MANYLELFRANVDARRRALGLTQKDVADALDVSQPTVSQKLSRNPTLETVAEFAGVLKCEPWQLLKPAGEEPGPDRSLSRILAVWEALDDSERNTVANVAESLANAKLGGKPSNTMAKDKKTRP